ncbi:MAG: sporulation initiation factor Spo0A C-terminal domain-containing protein [Lachnospira sp.]
MIFSEKGKTASKITAVKPSESKDKRLIQKIQHELNLIGISPKVVGYRYLTDAILATINEPKTRIFKVLGEKYKKNRCQYRTRHAECYQPCMADFRY